MTLKIFIKDPQKGFMDEMAEKYSFSDCSKAIQALIEFASGDNQETNDDFFDMRCVGKCGGPNISVSLEISNEETEYLKRMVEQYDIDEYDTEEENLGKAVRCIINYADQDGDPKSIFANKNS